MYAVSNFLDFGPKRASLSMGEPNIYLYRAMNIATHVIYFASAFACGVAAVHKASYSTRVSQFELFTIYYYSPWALTMDDEIFFEETLKELGMVYFF